MEQNLSNLIRPMSVVAQEAINYISGRRDHSITSLKTRWAKFNKQCMGGIEPNTVYSSLHVLPDGTPAALLLTEECSRTVYAVQLQPPFVWEDPLPPLPDCAAALTLTLTLRDVEAIDADPAALARRLCREAAGKHWLAHPKADTYLAGRIALLQRLYKR